jgi:hypothetical protein
MPTENRSFSPVDSWQQKKKKKKRIRLKHSETVSLWENVENSELRSFYAASCFRIVFLSFVIVDVVAVVSFASDQIYFEYVRSTWKSVNFKVIMYTWCAQCFRSFSFSSFSRCTHTHTCHNQVPCLCSIMTVHQHWHFTSYKVHARFLVMTTHDRHEEMKFMNTSEDCHSKFASWTIKTTRRSHFRLTCTYFVVRRQT